VLTFDDRDGVVVACLPAPALDFAVCRRHRAEWLDLAARAPHLVLDLSAVSYLDRFGFELLLEMIRICPGAARIAGASANVHHMFVCEQLDGIVPFDESVDAAVRAMKNASSIVA
jgi:anti-anti-sigma regulatory factor